MAIKLNSSQLKKLELHSYKDIRPHLETGDLMFCSGNYLGSKFVQRTTNSVWSHIAIVVKLQEIDRVMLIESIEDHGVRFSPVSNYFENYTSNEPYRGTIVFAKYDDLIDEQRKRIFSEGMDLQTCKYDWDQCFRILSRLLFKKGNPDRDKEFMCAELAAACYKKANIKLATQIGKFVVPNDFWLSPQVNTFWKVQEKD